MNALTTARRAALFAAAPLCLLCSGCGPDLEASPDAVSAPLLESDPREEAALDADVWPGFRGHNAQGIAPAGSPPIHFGPDAGWRWKTPLEGEGHSSPVVWGDAVLLTAALHDTDPPTLVLQCYDRGDGSLRWQSEVGRGQGSIHAKNSYAAATPATDGERIFAFFGTTGLFCYDFDGRRLWRADLGNLEHKWGTAASPVLYEDLVIQLCDCEANSAIAAFDKASGQQVWRTPRPSQGCWSTPVLVKAKSAGGNRFELVVNGTEASSEADRLIIAYDPASGKELWRVRGTSQFVTPTPMVCGELVVCASGRNGPIFAIRPGGSGDVTDDPSRILWRWRRGGPYIPSGVAYRNRVFLIRDDGSVDCYNGGDGEQIWRERLHGPFTASLVAADGRVYALNEWGQVSVFAAADTFELLATNDLAEDGRCLATPAIAGGDVFLRTPSYLYCFGGE